MISYLGGKSRISKFIIPNIPVDIETYVEPMGGMFWVFFKMDLKLYPNLKNIVYNDFNPLNTNLFNCVKYPKDFHDTLIKVRSQNRDLFYLYQNELFNTDLKLDLSIPNFDLGMKYVYVLSQVFSGTNPSKSTFIDLKDKYRSKYDSFVDKLVSEKWKSYFSKINYIENMDFEELIKKYDSEKTYFYCDPPYFNLGEKYYANNNFNINTHERLCNILKTINGDFGLSYYELDKLNEWFPKDIYEWKSMDFFKSSMAKNGKPQSKATELFITNYKTY